MSCVRPLPFKSARHDRDMAGSVPWSPMSPPPPTTYDPNALLRKIDQTTSQIFHWVRIGVVVIIILLIVVVLIG
jgi:hypothetical protein